MIQWERLLRWRTRTEHALATDDDPFDFMLILFASIFQMRDWLIASRSDLKSEIEQLFLASPDLRLARDLANASKHMTLKSYSVDAAAIARDYVGAGQVRHVVPRPGGSNLEALPLADACVEQLRVFMEQHGLR